MRTSSSSRSWASVVALLAACGSGDDTNPGTADASNGSGDGGGNPDASDVRPMDPNDPVEAVPAFTGAYTFGKLTTEDASQLGGTGTWFTEATTEHRVFTNRVHYARYRDGMLLQDKNGGSQVWIYDQATTTVGNPIALPSDAVGRAIIRGGMIYVGGLAKVYSYEIATSTWRMQPLAGTGTCQRVIAGKTRLFALCTKPTDSNTHELFSMWANKTMSDVVPIGSSSPVPTEPFTWMTAAADEDVAYFGSRNPTPGCIGKLTATTLEPCALPVGTLGNFTSTVYVKRGEITDNGANIYVSTFLSGNTSETDLFEINIATRQIKNLRSIDDNAFAVCPDHSVVYQDFTISERYAGGVATAVRLGAGGDYDMGCPLKPL